jgi:hypothetical protein
VLEGIRSSEQISNRLDTCGIGRPTLQWMDIDDGHVGQPMLVRDGLKASLLRQPGDEVSQALTHLVEVTNQLVRAAATG